MCEHLLRALEVIGRDPLRQIVGNRTPKFRGGLKNIYPKLGWSNKVSSSVSGIVDKFHIFLIVQYIDGALNTLADAADMARDISYSSQGTSQDHLPQDDPACTCQSEGGDQPVAKEHDSTAGPERRKNYRIDRLYARDC